MKTKTLHLNLKGVYWRAVKDGTKGYEYRLVTDYWRRRIEGREYDYVVFHLGYSNKTIRRRWKTPRIETITHEFFGEKPVTVYAIPAQII